MPNPMMPGTVSIGPVFGLPMVERPSFADKAAAISGTMLDLDDCGFAGLVPQTTDKDQSDDPVLAWVMPIVPVPAVMDLCSVTPPALPPPTVEAVEQEDAGTPDLKPPVGVAYKGVLPEGILTPSSEPFDPEVEFVQGVVLRPTEGIDPVAIKVPGRFLAVSLQGKVSASDAALEPLPKNAGLGDPAPAHKPDKVAAGLSALPAPLPTMTTDPAQPQTTAAPVRADATGNGLAALTISPSLPLDPAGIMSVADPLMSAGDEVQLPSALMLRFESEGRANPVRPLVLMEVQGIGERPRIEAFRPEIVTPAAPDHHPEPGPKETADPPKAEGLGPEGITTTVAPAHARQPPFVLPVARSEDDDGVTELTVPASSQTQTTSVGGRFLPTESQKIAAPILSPLLGQVMDAVIKGADGATTLTLSPEELGKVRLKFRPDTQNADRMVVMLGFDRPETMELFRRHADQLADALRSAGYAGVQIGFGGAGDGESGQPFDRGPSNGGEGDDIAMTDESITVLTPLRNGPYGGLDLRL